MVTQQRHTISPEAIEGNVLHRAANTDESEAQRIERQQSAVSWQLQGIGRALAGDNNAGPCDTPSNGSQEKYEAVVDGILHGVGSQFVGRSGPLSESLSQARR